MKNKKFIVWIVTAILFVSSMIFPKRVDADMINLYLLITVAFYSGNTAITYMFKDKENK